ncbi:YCF48-related protein [Tengunoibacter tsumagoiensis]|uniref:Photosynthesis system II assembly factor Ycf48/Hcf136-like domain-containing protein n=1 Tax=Tengunoibacter tsumagoiensis TaxID=2014871 RepID=A0A401ZWF6_9CHLR|nr:hypothetical protein [Tengunoibacter tsumagoiensis]GCE11239.1 hypothetical protein KTT_10980 [Tengunoibacter tsumagoiensis]
MKTFFTSGLFKYLCFALLACTILWTRFFLVTVNVHSGYVFNQQSNKHYSPSQCVLLPSSLLSNPPYGNVSPPLSSLYGVKMFSADNGWAVGGIFARRDDPGDKDLVHLDPESGNILQYSNNSWHDSDSAPLPLFALSFSSPQDGWAVGCHGTLMHYSNQKWQSIQSPTTATLYSVAMLPDGSGWAAGTDGVLLHYDGQNWQQVASGTTKVLHSIAMWSDDEGWAVGEEGMILHYQSGSWQEVVNSSSATLNAVTLSSANEGWAVGEQGTILHYRDGSWQLVKSEITFHSSYVNLLTIAMPDIRQGWIIGEEQTLLTYQNEVWTDFASKLPWISLARFYSMSLSSGDEGWAVGVSYGGAFVGHYHHGKWDMVQ